MIDKNMIVPESEVSAEILQSLSEHGIPITPDYDNRVVVMTGDHAKSYKAEGGDVNITNKINIVLPENNIQDVKTLAAIQNFSKDYFQLIVTTEDFFDKNSLTMSRSRSFIEERTPPEIMEKCSSLTDEGVDKLLRIPAIICQESRNYYGVPTPEQKAVYAYLKKIKVFNDQIKIYFQPIDMFDQMMLAEYNVDFNIRMGSAISDLNFTHWEVKKLNLFEIFTDVGIQVQMPQ